MAGDAMAEVSALGPYFAVVPHRVGEGWRSLRELLAPVALEERVGNVRRALETWSGTAVEDRVAASTLALGLFSRVLSPVLAARVLGVPLPRPGTDTVWWQAVDAGPWPIALTGEPGPADIEGVLREVVEPLVAGLASPYALSRQVLDGNAASAVFGAALMIAAARPDLGPRAEAEARALLDGPLRGTGSYDGRFVRASCCLYYRVPGGGYCGDCVLLTS